MPEQTHDTLCIEPDSGILEDCPAVFEINSAETSATLVSFTVGAWSGARPAAVAMTGEGHVAQQEAMVLTRWLEGEPERRAAWGAMLDREREDAA